MVFNREGDSIEGEKVTIQSRNIVPRIGISTPLGRAFSYKCNRNACALITQVVEDDLDIWFDCNSNRNQDDKLDCLTLDFYHLGNKRMNIEVKEGVTGRHGAQFIFTKTRTYAKIFHPFSNLAFIFKKQAYIEGAQEMKKITE